MEIYLVGGAVRDQLLNYPVYDKDWVVVGATVQDMLDQGFQPVGKDFPVFIHPDSGEEYALARTERKSGKGYTGFNYFASPDVTLEQDLCRRDLTINAMALSHDEQLVDPYGGRDDLNNRILRHVSDAFAEDPLRVLRVARFYARYQHLGFEVAPDTLALMRQLSASDELEHLTTERVWKETERALAENSPLAYFRLLNDCGALQKLFTPLQRLFNASDEQLAQLEDAQLNAMELFSSLLCLRFGREHNAGDQAKALCQQLKTPKAWQDQAQQLCDQHQKLTKFSALSGDSRFEMIQSLDLLRRPQRLNSLLNCCKALFPDQTPSQEKLETLLDKLNQFAPKALMAEGFTGKALGDELKRRRSQICADFTF